MIRRTCRRAAFVVGAAAVLTAAGFPVLSGTAHAATVTPAPSSAANAGDVSVTLTAGVTISTATGATLTKSDDPSVKIDATSLSNPGQPSFTQRVATFPLLNKLPGHYDITVTESGGTESCAACFTISGLPPTVHLSPPTAIVVNSTATGTLTITNPARGSVYPKVRVKLDISGDPGLTANQMTLTAASGATNFPTQLMDSGGDVIAFVGDPAGTPLGQNQSYVITLTFGAKPAAPPGQLSITTTLGDVNATGDLTDALATEENAPSAITTAPAGATYHPVAAVRVLDTRSGLGGHTGKLGSGASFALVVGGKNTVPTSATAVAINLTATNASGPGYLVAYPGGTAKPPASNIDYVPGASVANLAVVPLSSSTHALRIANGLGASVDVLGDLVGYYDPTPGGLSYVPLPPARVLDTRSGGGAPIGAGGVRTLTVAGAGGVPASGATAAVVNVTATQGTRVGYLQVFETGKPEPNTSIVDYGANQTIANLAIVPLSSDGRLTVVNHSSGTVHVLIDVQGYFRSASASSLHPVAISRASDTRTGSGTPLAGRSSMTISLGGRNGLPPSGITMVAVNLTATQPGAAGYLTAYASGAARPATSNVDFVKGQTIATLAYVKVTDSGGLTIYNGGSSPVHVIVDVEGWGSSP